MSSPTKTTLRLDRQPGKQTRTANHEVAATKLLDNPAARWATAASRFLPVLHSVVFKPQPLRLGRRAKLSRRCALSSVSSLSWHPTRKVGVGCVLVCVFRRTIPGDASHTRTGYSSVDEVGRALRASWFALNTKSRPKNSPENCTPSASFASRTIRLRLPIPLQNHTSGPSPNKKQWQLDSL